MTHGPRRPILITVALAAAMTAACSPATTTPAPSGATVSPSRAAESALTAPTAPPTPTPSPTAVAGCPIASQTGRLPSDRLVDVVISSTATADIVTFVFGDDSLPGPPGAPEGTLGSAEPPFVEGASGEPIELEGEHVALIRFAGMSIVNDVGQPVYDGQLSFQPDTSTLRHVVNSEMFEGVVSWYIGYDGVGCLTLASDGRNVSVIIDHAAG